MNIVLIVIFIIYLNKLFIRGYVYIVDFGNYWIVFRIIFVIVFIIFLIMFKGIIKFGFLSVNGIVFLDIFINDKNIEVFFVW